MTPPPSQAPAAISIVIPVYNERHAVAETLNELSRVMQNENIPYEIIVVDDGSTDGTRDVVAALATNDIRLLCHETNRGYGATLKTGFASARYDWLAFLDADGSYPPAELPRLIQMAVDADMVVGDRVKYRDQASWARGLGKSILHPLANYLVGRKIPDLNSGMRVVRRSLVERYWPLYPDGFSLTTTLTMAFLSAGWRVRYEPISYLSRKGRSKIRPIRDMRNFIILILRTVTYFHPLKVYVPLCTLLLLASIAVVVISKFITHQVMDITALFLFIAGLQMLLIGVLADLVMKLLGTRK